MWNSLLIVWIILLIVSIGSGIALAVFNAYYKYDPQYNYTAETIKTIKGHLERGIAIPLIVGAVYTVFHVFKINLL